MSNDDQSNSGEQIPAGFTPEVWNQLTPEQKAQYREGAQQQGAGAPNMQAQQDQIMKTAQKTMFISMALGFLGSIFHMLIGRFLGSNNDR